MEIIFEPYKRVIIHNIRQLNYETMIKIHQHNAYSDSKIPILLWANGLLFTYSDLTESEIQSSILLQGEKHIDNITFAEMEKYKDRIELNDKSFQIIVSDISEDYIMNELTKWLKVKFSPENKGRESKS